MIHQRQKTKVLIAGAGGAPSEGVINSLLESNENFEVIGMGSEPTDLVMSNAVRKYLVPYANESKYRDILLKILEKEKPNLIHFQNDLEVYHASLLRNEIQGTGTMLFMPEHDVIETCVNKWKSYLKFQDAGITVPQNIIINNTDDLKRAFSDLGDKNGCVWFRASSIGGGGKGAIPSNDYEFVRGWIDRNEGWGDFIAAQMLTKNTVTWLSVWYNGELIVAQTRKRGGWVHGNRSASGVTGVTKVGITDSNPMVDEIAKKAVFAVSDKPHGIFGVDMAYDNNGIPNPTEINISRFFTTILFFTKAGLNIPEIFVNLALYGKKPDLEKTINPLPNGLMWLRGMDYIPRLITSQELQEEIISL